LKSIKYIIFLLGTVLSLNAQDFSDEWTGYFSYNNITDVARGDDRIFAAADNAVFVYDLIDQSISTISTINGLSGETISAIYFSTNFDTLFIGYENGLMDVLVGDNPNVLTVVDILNRQSIPPTEKRINHFLEFNGFVYISTGFGISLFSLTDLEFDDTYFIGDNGSRLNVVQMAILDEFIYAATTDFGIRRAIAENDNLIDFANWTNVRPGNYDGIVSFNNALFAATVGGQNLIRSTDGTNWPLFTSLGDRARSLDANAQFFTTTLEENVLIFDSDENQIASIGAQGTFQNDYTNAVIIDQLLFIGTLGSGVLQLPFSNQSQVTQLLPDGPLSNNSFYVEAIDNELWNVFGEYNVSYNPGFPDRIGVSHLVVDEGWTNIPTEELFGSADLVNIAINPLNTNQVFISSFGDGLLEINDNIPTTLFDENNSTLEELVQSNGNTVSEEVRINGLVYDDLGNLYINNARTPNGLHLLTQGGQFSAISLQDALPDFSGTNGLDDMVIANDGNIFIATSNSGIIGYNPNTGAQAQISDSEAQDTPPVDDIRALVIDNNGTMWVGTRRGLRIFFSPSSIFTEEPTSLEPIIILENDIAQELLNDQAITDILVDGSNNKWVGTVNSGVFLFSPNGQETLFQFNENNSPLPINNVQDMALDPVTGVVYFATTQGLVSFNGPVTAPAENLENVIVYPNPVRPSFDGLVTIEGLTDNTNVKITDIVGNLVHEENTTAGNITWDTTAFGRHRVASGVYLILITGPNAEETQIKKLMIVR